MEQTLRRRLTLPLIALCALALAAGPLLLPATADDLDKKHKQAQNGVKNAQEAVEDSSAALYTAMTKLRLARTQLGNAQRRLARTEGQLVAARVLDRQMQVKLTRAVADLMTA